MSNRVHSLLCGKSFEASYFNEQSIETIAEIFKHEIQVHSTEFPPNQNSL